MIDWHSLRNSVLDFFFPERCAVCGRIAPFGKHICPACDIAFERDYKTAENGNAVILTVCEYSEHTRPIVFGAKNGRDGDKLDFIAAEISRCITAELNNTVFDAVIPVPMYFSDKQKRGYNQTEKICRELSYLLKVPYLNALRKTRKTVQQKSLGGKKRQENLLNSFALRDGISLKGKTLLIVDDVTTTGATFREILRTLENSGCNRIVCAAFARAVKQKEKTEINF